MFGEQSIYGQTIVRIGDKKRIVIPRFTGAEKGEKLLLVRELLYTTICTREYYDKKIDMIEEKINSTINQEERKQLELELLRLSQSILRNLTVDGQNRVIIGDVFCGSKEINCVGAKNKLILMPKEKTK